MVSKICRKVYQPVPGVREEGTKAPMVAGRLAMAWAKMMGITPVIFTFRGRWLDWPPYIFRPTTRLAYCTGMRRSAFWMNTMNTTMASIPIRIATTPTGWSRNAPSVVTPLAQFCTPTIIYSIMEGPRDRMPANRMIEIPLPMPNSVICSPSHMMKADPAVKDTMITMAAHQPGTPVVSSTLTPLEAPAVLIRV